MTIVLSPAAWNAAHDVRPWNGCILTPSMTAARSPRGTLTFAMPFFTSGLTPVIFAISSASGSSAAAPLAISTVTVSSNSTRVVFMTFLPSSSPISSVRDAASVLGSAEANPMTGQGNQSERCSLPTAYDSITCPYAPGEAPHRDQRYGEPEQDVEGDGTLQTEQMRQPIVQAVPEGRVRTEVGARVTNARQDRRDEA